ncbi:MAG: MFS transporter, partial [Verrucomicrobia bacterium]|nr:MFS transporter [Verrucomicrobiota bacterium]
EVDLGSISFLNNDRLKECVEKSNAAPDQIAEAARINSETRLRAPKTGFIVLAGLSPLALVPRGWLPDCRPGQISAESKSKKA